MSSTEIKALVASLQEAISAENESDAVKALQGLKDLVKPTEEVLRETRAGVAVGKLRNHASSEIGALAKSIVKIWKDAVEENKKRKASSSTGDDAAPKQKKSKSEKGSAAASSTNSPSSTPVPSTSNSKPSSSASSSRPISSLPKSSSHSDRTSDYPSIVTPYPSSPRTFKGDGAHKPGLGDEVRDKCVMLVYDALAGDSNVSKEVLLEKSKGVEKGFFSNNENKTDNAYRQKIRGICMNLKDKANPGLRDAVVRGEVKALDLSTMSKEDMASQTLQALNKKLETENLFNSRGAEQIAAETDQFKCGKCGQRKTTYYQMQTRSADEPMTTFVTCLNCNNRWKFS
ncbi:transcription elongation factor [Mrakia frigida]|uniref:transcription elongation factor DST1 n=1 Tax=Mrakia frigida TaxID=29902 RepID=UPI003FCBFE18